MYPSHEFARGPNNREFNRAANYPERLARYMAMLRWPRFRNSNAYAQLDPEPAPYRRRAPWRNTVMGISVFASIGWAAISVLYRSGALVGVSETVVTSSGDWGEGRAAFLRASTVQMDAAEVTDHAMEVRVWNDYQEAETNTSLQLYPWEHIAEPHRRTMMEVASWNEDALGESVDFRWTVEGTVLGIGNAFETAFGAPGTYKCTVAAIASPDRTPGSDGHEPNSDDEIAAERVFVVTVKYIRREIRSLTDFDREKFFNAVSVLQRVPSAVGQQVYGKKYYSKDYFNRLHLYYGGQEDCDHWHDGPGFVTSHIAISLMFEQSLQAVDPAIALPYWDFTVEGTKYDWSNFRSSSVFSDDWFGTAAPRNTIRTPDRGRFAFIPSMTNASEYSAVMNSFGMLRSPWNNDPTPFLTRHDRLFGYENNRKPAGCKQYRDAVHEDSWMSLTEAMNAGAHGHIHELLGGTWAEEWTDLSLTNRTEEIVFPFLHSVVPLMKYLWRMQYLTCPESCSTDLSWKQCQCTCSDGQVPKEPSEVLEKSGLLDKAVGAFFYDHNMKLITGLSDEQGHAKPQIEGYSEEETAAIYRALLSVLCTPMLVGSHYEGTSTNDFTFWVLHPTFDRLWHLTRLEQIPGFDETWRDDHSCYGHNPSNIQPFHNLFVGDEPPEREDGLALAKKYYTNQQLYNLLHPAGLTLPYVYDHFDWNHCDTKPRSIVGSCLVEQELEKTLRSALFQHLDTVSQ